ncbi:MAG: hypothetical protein CL868_12770 [Cytophagaceae bacterium]|nr:hypothetical protein [Cytophagaceae bacterium]
MKKSVDTVSAKNRIAYEAFSKFSGNIGRSESFEDLAQVVRKSSKYFFDYRILRIVILKNRKPTIFTFVGSQYTLEKFRKNVMQHEWKLIKNQIPILRDDEEVYAFKDHVEISSLIAPKMWGWYRKYEDVEVAVSLLTDQVKKFATSDLEILQLLIESLVIKFQQICLQIELAQKNKRLEKAVKEIEQKNERIKDIIENQLKIIEQRTREIKRKNEKLMEISTLNAHNLREPLTRVMGLMNLAEYIDENELKREILERMKISVSDMDKTLKDIIIKTEKEMVGLTVING